MITTKQQMALECLKAEHQMIKSPVYKEIRGNLLRTYKRYMRYDKTTLHNRCLIALAYNCDIMVRHKLHKPRPLSEVEILRRQLSELNERFELMIGEGE